MSAKRDTKPAKRRASTAVESLLRAIARPRPWPVEIRVAPERRITFFASVEAAAAANDARYCAARGLTREQLHTRALLAAAGGAALAAALVVRLGLDGREEEARQLAPRFREMGLLAPGGAA